MIKLKSGREPAARVPRRRTGLRADDAAMRMRAGGAQAAGDSRSVVHRCGDSDWLSGRARAWTADTASNRTARVPGYLGQANLESGSADPFLSGGHHLRLASDCQVASNPASPSALLHSYLARPPNALASSCAIRCASFCEVVSISNAAPSHSMETICRSGCVKPAR